MGFELNKLCEKAKVRGIDKQVLSKICDHANPKNNYECWPSNKLLASEIGRSVRSVQRAIKSLCLKGYISVKKRKWSNSIYPSNVYRIKINKLEKDNGFFLEKNKAVIINFPK